MWVFPLVRIEPDCAPVKSQSHAYLNSNLRFRRLKVVLNLTPDSSCKVPIILAVQTPESLYSPHRAYDSLTLETMSAASVKVFPSRLILTAGPPLWWPGFPKINWTWRLASRLAGLSETRGVDAHVVEPAQSLPHARLIVTAGDETPKQENSATQEDILCIGIDRSDAHRVS